MRLVDIAKKYIGLTGPDGDDSFIAWFNRQTGAGLPLDGTAWCQIFVTYCLAEAGAENFPITAGCTQATNWYKARGLWHDNDGSYSPAQGDIIYFNFDPEEGEDSDHVGIVSYLDNRVHTIEGNYADSVRELDYAYDDPDIRGYATPKYRDEQIFSDIEGHWAKDAILRCAAAGLLKGDELGRFRPDEPTTRAELATVISRLLDMFPKL